MATQDRGYASLLSHLHNSSSSLPFSTIQAALAHHLANLSPLPTPLAATAVSSPLYLSQPLTYAKTQSLATSFRHAVHLKYRALVDNHKRRSVVGSVFGSSMQSSMGNWINATVKGIQGGHPVLRLACCSGLLLGVEDLSAAKKAEREGLEVDTPRGNVEDELALALAEVIDTYAYTYNSETSSAEEWESEFQQGGQAILFLALIMAAESLPLADNKRLKALPLPILGRLLISTISSAFESGEFLSSMQPSISRSSTYGIVIPTSSPLAHRIHAVSTSFVMASISSLSKLTAKVYALSFETTTTSRVWEALQSASFVLQTTQDMAKKLELEWSMSSLADASENDIAPESRNLTTAIWTILKTFLFSAVMLSDAILSASVFVPSSSYLNSPVTPSTLALQTLHTLSHLSFTISQFGGVSSTAQGFRELKKTFYMALDILAQDDGNSDSVVKANTYIRESCNALKSNTIQRGAQSIRQAKQAYVLACAEQLVPVLNEDSLKDWVWAVCYPHLSDPSNRETFESAHSVVLTIFASYARKRLQQKEDEHADITAAEKADGPMLSARFVKYMIPFYVQCLIDNSADGRLSNAQLCLAFSALVRSAGASAIDMPSSEAHALSWYCIQRVLDTTRILSAQISDPKGKGKAIASDYEEDSDERLHRLHLMLVASVSSVPLALMMRVLNEIRGIVISYALPNNNKAPEGDIGKKRQVLVDALFEEILEQVGDREKEGAVIWWYQNRAALTNGIQDSTEGRAPKEADETTLARL